MLDLDNNIPATEIADLFGSNPQTVRAQVEKGKIFGFGKGKLKIPRLRFYKDCGWYTDEEIKHAYKMAGLELKEKAAAATATQD